MDKIIHLSLARKSTPPFMDIVQSATAPGIKFILDDYTPEHGSTARIYILKGDAEVYNDCTLEGNVVSYTPTTGSFDVPGQCVAQLQILKGEAVAVSYRIFVKVEPNLILGSAAPATTEFDALTDLIIDAEQYSGAIRDLQETTEDLQYQIDHIDIPDGSITTSKLANGAVDFAKLSNDVKLKINKNYVTPEMYGAVGDGVTDDSDALQLAFSNEEQLPILLSQKYYITREMIVGGRNNFTIEGSDSEIIYSGTGSAIVIQKLSYGNISFGTITAENGNCIEFRAISWITYSSYIKLSFEHLVSPRYCIYVNCKAKGYSNQCQVYGGRCSGGGIAVYMQNETEAHKYNTNEWQFNTIGIEGVSTGFKFESLYYPIQGVSINYPRFREDTEITTLVQIIGQTAFVELNNLAAVKPSHFNIDSNDNMLQINAPLNIDNRIVTYNAKFRRGVLTEYTDLTSASVANYLDGILNPTVINSPNASTKAMSETYNPISIAEDMVSEAQLVRTKLVYCYGNTGYEAYAPVTNGLYILLQRVNTVRIITMISTRFYINTYSPSGGWSGWNYVMLSPL